MKLHLYPSGAQLFFQLVHHFDLERLVLQSPMAHDRHLDFAGVQVVERRAAVPDHTSVDLGRLRQGQQRQGPAHAKPGYAYFAGPTFEELHGAADILAGCVAKVEAVHQVVRFFGLHG